jgi:hypothetical protein
MTNKPDNFVPRINGYSPWGQIDNITRLADGILLVSTASHGGIWLSLKRRVQLAGQSPWAISVVEGRSYCAKPMWWEEDCEATLPLLAFWDELPAAMRRESYYAQMARTANHTYGINLSEAA